MSINKKFLEAVSKDEALKTELEQATLEALGEFLKSKGLEDEVEKVTESAMMKVAEAHGFKSDEDEMEEISEDEMKAVAGGVCACPILGGGTGNGKQCFCLFPGKGTNNSGKLCKCPGFGVGADA